MLLLFSRFEFELMFTAAYACTGFAALLLLLPHARFRSHVPNEIFADVSITSG